MTGSNWMGIMATMLSVGSALGCPPDMDRERIHKMVRDYIPENQDYTDFAVLGPKIQQKIITAKELDPAGITDLRDILIASRIGYSDASKLVEENIIDAQGEMKNDDAYYEFARIQRLHARASQNWSQTEVDWARDRFEILRIRESKGNYRDGEYYEANMALLRHKPTGNYVISIGGTETMEDVFSDINLVVNEGSGASLDAILAEVDRFFAEDIPQGSKVILAGHSLGGGEAVGVYRTHPERYHHVYTVQAVGLGGLRGTYFAMYVWDQMGDAKITEVIGDDPGIDFNDLVVGWGYIGAGEIICIDDIQSVGESELRGPDNDFLDAHKLGNMWESF